MRNSQGPKKMELTRCMREDPAAGCSWCGALSADHQPVYVLVGISDETSLAAYPGAFVEYPVPGARRTVPAYVRPADSPGLEGARTDYNLLFVSCTAECANALSRALEADENAVSIEQWSGKATEGAGVPRPEGRSSRSIAPSSDGRYIILRIVGDYTRQRAMMNNIQAHALGRELGIKRYLVDMTESRNVESVLANYEFAKKEIWNAPEIDTTAVVAIVVSPDDHSHDFIETVARNAGLQVTIFRDRARAEEHLSAGGEGAD